MLRRLGSQSILMPIALIGLFCVFALALLWKPVLRGDVFLPTDALLHMHPWRYSYERVPVNNATSTDPIKQVYPRRVLVNEILQEGELPLWNKSVLTGYPMLADGQLGLFFPASLLFVALPLSYAYGAYAFLQVVIAGLGAWLFARRIYLSAGASLIVGLCYMFNGYLLTWLQFPHHTGATALLPWCFWAVERACQRRTWPAWLLAGVVLGLPVLSHFQLSFYIYVAVGLYVLVRAIPSGAWRLRWNMLLGFSAAIIVALALSAVQMLPAVAMASQGQRSDLGVAVGNPDEQFTHLLRMAMPLLGGTPKDPAAVGLGPNLHQVPLGYTSLAALLLAVVALASSRHPLSSFFGVLATGAFAMAVSSPLLQLFMILVPPYRQFEDHLRWFVVWGFAIAVLAGMGAQALMRIDIATNVKHIVLRNRILLGAVAIFVAIWGLNYIQLFQPGSKYGIYITLIRQQQLGMFALFALLSLIAVGLLRLRRLRQPLSLGLVLVVMLADLLWNGGFYNSSVPRNIVQPTDDLTAALAQYDPQPAQLYPPSSQLAFLQQQDGIFRIHGGDYEVLAPNFASAYGLEDIRGYVSLYSERYNRLVRLIDGKDYSQTGEGDISFRAYLTSAYENRRLLDMLNVEYILFAPGSQNVELYQPLELVLRDDEGTIYRNPNVLPRAWLVHQTLTLDEDMQQLDALADPQFDPATTAIVGTQAPAVAPASAPEPVPSVSYGPNSVSIQAQVSAPAILVLSDSYDSEWQVTVDGQPAELLRTNYTFRGVWLDAGTHTVEFRYVPRMFWLGVWISAITTLLAIIAGLWIWRRKPNEEAE